MDELDRALAGLRRTVARAGARTLAERRWAEERRAEERRAEERRAEERGAEATAPAAVRPGHVIRPLPAAPRAAEQGVWARVRVPVLVVLTGVLLLLLLV